MASRKLYGIVVTLVALAIMGASLTSSCANHRNIFRPVHISPQAAVPRFSTGGPPPVLELDELLADTPRIVSADSQVVSNGSDYSPAGSGASGSDPNCIEPSGTSLNLRAYGAGDYTYALFIQQIGDGTMGGGRDDEIPLSSLIEVSPSTYGGGRDEEIPLSFYMGFSDFSVGAWRWYGPFGSTEETTSLYTSDMKNRFKSPEDNFYTCILTSSGGHAASSLPASGYVGALPFALGDKASSATEAPYGVTVNRVVTNAGLGDGTVPGVVTGVSASMDAIGPVTVTWDANPDPEVTSYKVYRTVWDDPNGWSFRTLLGEVNIPDLQYYDNTSVTMATYVYEVSAVNTIGEGGPGFDSAGPPRFVGSPWVSPWSGASGETVQFNAPVAGSDPITYAWDFAGAATPNTSPDPAPLVVMGVEGTYDVSLNISNAFGSAGRNMWNFQVLSPGQGWHIQAVISAGSAGQYSSLACIDGSFAAITCASSAGLMFVMSNDYVHPVTWRTPVVVESGSGIGDYCSLSTVGGNPALTYFGWDIRYRQATGYYGDTWSPPVTLAPLGGMAQGTSLCVVNGNPAATFFNDTPAAGLKFVRASDSYGTSWGAVANIDNANAMTGYFSSLAVINGNPAVAYYSSGLKYIRASDADGAAWNAPVVVDDGSTKGNFASLKSVAGRPAIAYYEYLGLGAGARLMYVRALDANGDAWGTPQALDTQTGAGAGSWCSLAVIGGKPAVSYANDETFNLMYIRALDGGGVEWGAPEIVDASGQVGGYTSLIELHGSPAISYWNFYEDDLMFANYY
jgi:hypothetical protein